jgi:hypothetical protein
VFVGVCVVVGDGVIAPCVAVLAISVNVALGGICVIVGCAVIVFIAELGVLVGKNVPVGVNVSKHPPHSIDHFRSGVTDPQPTGKPFGQPITSVGPVVEVGNSA